MTAQLQLIKDIIRISDIIEVTYRQGCSEARYVIMDRSVEGFDKTKLNQFFNTFYDINSDKTAIKEVSTSAAEGFKVGDDVYSIDDKLTHKHYTIKELKLYASKVVVDSDNSRIPLEFNIGRIRKLHPFYFINSDGAICKSFKEFYTRKYAATRALGTGFETKEAAEALINSKKDQITGILQNMRSHG